MVTEFKNKESFFKTHFNIFYKTIPHKKQVNYII